MKPRAGDVVYIGGSLCLLYMEWHSAKTDYVLSNILLDKDLTRKGGMTGKDLERTVHDKKVLFNLADILGKIINE
jgi:hypothetical protein